MNIIVKDSLNFLELKYKHEADIIFCDPPYGLGSEVIIKQDGKPDYYKAADFMSKWDMPTGPYWESWFKEAYRTLKHGGYCVMYGMDRQLLLFKYYAALAGFGERQSLYWYFISNFPKAYNIAKGLEGYERTGSANWKDWKNLGGKEYENKTGYTKLQAKQGYRADYSDVMARDVDLTTPLAKKYDGYKYSVSPLKQTNETIMVFQKPYKTGSCLHDTLAYENGDKTCCCGALDIDGGRCPTESDLRRVQGRNKNTSTPLASNNGFISEDSVNLGRYPAQTFVSPEAGEVLDRQSGKGIGPSMRAGDRVSNNDGILPWNRGRASGREVKGAGFTDTGGCSKILHKCPYEEGEMDLYMYCPKVSKQERNGGLDEFPVTLANRDNAALTSAEDRLPQSRNPHPTLKPISLNERILRLFKTPNPQKILYPFAGSGSEVIGGIRAGFTDWEACEINPEYVAIAEARIKHWSEKTAQDIIIFPQ